MSTAEHSTRRLPFPTTISPLGYRRVVDVALVALTLIVMTGAAVRLTGSGLGCPDWPKCYGGAVAPLQTHAMIEYGNRVISGIVVVIAIAAGLLAFRRRPYRRELAMVGLLLPLGVLSQAVLGGLTVRSELAPEFVMGHYILSMMLLDATVALNWMARHEPGWRAREADRLAVWSVRGLLPLGALAIWAGTAATAAGPHAGGEPGQKIQRLAFDGSNTMDLVIHYHGAIALALGIAILAVLALLVVRRSARFSVRPLMVAGVLLACQGAVGITQYLLKLPTELVWVHVSIAAVTWASLVWAAAAAGRLAPRGGEHSSASATAARERASA